MKLFVHALHSICCIFSDPETRVCSCRELLLIVGFILLIQLILTTALLGNVIISVTAIRRC